MISAIHVPIKSGRRKTREDSQRHLDIFGILNLETKVDVVGEKGDVRVFPLGDSIIY